MTLTAFQESGHIKSRQENPWFCVKNNIFANVISTEKKSQNGLKTYKKLSWKQDSEKRAFGINFPSILDSKTIQNEVPGPSKNRPGNGLKKRSKKMRTLPFYGHFGGGLGEPGTLIFPPFFSHRQLWGPKWLPGLPREPPGAIRASFFYDFASFFIFFFYAFAIGHRGRNSVK